MDSMNPISVIVAIYNAEKTLDRCIESILSQTFDQFGLILVDDGSQDGSAEKCDMLAEKYDNVVVVHKENEGLGPTRNVGLQLADSKYVYQMDSDDWIDQSLVETAYRTAEGSNAELVIFGYKLYTEDDGAVKEYGIVRADSCVINGNENAKKYFSEQLVNSFFVLSACNKLIRRDFILRNQIMFQPLRRSQDVLFSLDVFEHVTQIAVLDQLLYQYVIVPGVFKKNASADNLLAVYEQMRSRFTYWGLYNGEIQHRLDYLYLSQIFNFISYLWLNTSERAERCAILNEIMQNQRIKNLSRHLRSKHIPSRFIRLIKLFYDLGIKGGMGACFRLHSLKEKVTLHRRGHIALM